MPFTDPLDRYAHVRADRRALAQLREAHPEEYERFYAAEDRLIREQVGEKGLEDVKTEAKTGPRPESPMGRRGRRVGGCVICAMEKREREARETEAREARETDVVPHVPDDVAAEPDDEEPDDEEIPAQVLETPVSSNEAPHLDVSPDVGSAEIPNPVTESAQVSETYVSDTSQDDPYTEPADPDTECCEWRWPDECWEDGAIRLLRVGDEPVVSCHTHEQQWRRKLRLPDAPRVVTS